MHHAVRLYRTIADEYGEPLPLMRVFQDRHITLTIKPVSDPSFTGSSLMKRGRWQIVVNAGLKTTEMFYVIYHELYHCIADPDRKSDEMQAEIFAALILSQHHSTKILDAA